MGGGGGGNQLISMCTPFHQTKGHSKKNNRNEVRKKKKKSLIHKQYIQTQAIVFSKLQRKALYFMGNVPQTRQTRQTG